MLFLLLGGVASAIPLFCDKIYPRVVRLSACVSVTLVHPAKAVGHYKMPFGRDIRVAPSNTALDRGPVSPGEEKIWGSETPNRRGQPPLTVNIFSIVVLKARKRMRPRRSHGSVDESAPHNRVHSTHCRLCSSSTSRPAAVDKYSIWSSSRATWI